MSLIKTPDEIEKLRRGGRMLSGILGELVAMVKPGAMTGDLDAYAERRMREQGAEPSFKGYKPTGTKTPFNSTVCMSINQEVVHAPAYPSRQLKDGDLFKLDIGLWYEGLCTDMAVTVPVGNAKEEYRKLARVTRDALMAGVAKANEGAWISEIGKAVDKHVRKHGYSTVKALVGHGVGHAVHEDPPVPNYFDEYFEPVRIKRGMVLALEPMVNIGEEDVHSLPDEWTIATDDGTWAAHFEVTIAITEQGTEIVTPLPDVPGL
jgi:methionyl aminopeptidase